MSIRETQLQSEACSVAGGVQVPNESANLYIMVPRSHAGVSTRLSKKNIKTPKTKREQFQSIVKICTGFHPVPSNSLCRPSTATNTQPITPPKTGSNSSRADTNVAMAMLRHRAPRSSKPEFSINLQATSIPMSLVKGKPARS